jgi:hypothetical protein
MCTIRAACLIILTQICQELLRLRNFTLGKKLSDEDIIGSGGLDRITDLISCMVPFVSYGVFIVGFESALFVGRRRFEFASTDSSRGLEKTHRSKRLGRVSLFKCM